MVVLVAAEEYDEIDEEYEYDEYDEEKGDAVVVIVVFVVDDDNDDDGVVLPKDSFELIEAVLLLVQEELSDTLGL